MPRGLPNFVDMLNGSPCPNAVRAIKDALEVLEGKWKLIILFTLSQGPQRFGQLGRELEGISDRTLSLELKRLEASHLIERCVVEGETTVIEYRINAHGRSLQKVMEELRAWGMEHRTIVLGAPLSAAPPSS